MNCTDFYFKLDTRKLQKQNNFSPIEIINKQNSTKCSCMSYGTV